MPTVAIFTMTIKIAEKRYICLKKAHYENVTIYLLSIKCVTAYLEVFIAIIRFQSGKEENTFSVMVQFRKKYLLLGIFEHLINIYRREGMAGELPKEVCHNP